MMKETTKEAVSKTFTPRTVGLLAYLLVVLLLLATRILVSERVFGANTDFFYSRIFKVLAEIVCMGAIPVVAYVWISKSQKCDLPDLLNVKPKLSWSVWALVVGFSVLQYVFNSGVFTFWQGVCNLIGYDGRGVEVYFPTDFWGVLVEIFFTAMLPAVFEELSHRGLLLCSLDGKPKTVAILSALSFALMHQNFGQFGYTFVGGLWTFALIYYTGSVLPAVIMHFSNNLFSVLSTVGEKTSQGFLHDVVGAINGFCSTEKGFMISVGVFVLCGAAMFLILRSLKKKQVARYSPFSEKPFNADEKSLYNLLLAVILAVSVAAEIFSLVKGIIA